MCGFNSVQNNVEICIIVCYLQFKEKEPLPEHPGGVNPETGEVGGPRGPEPTRYGDWERKGRVTDF